jgi:LacI family transcriptional regulator
MSKPTIKVLARELGLAVSTVSKALRDSHEISQDTKDKVLQLARELNYIPNPYASSLRRQKSRTIAVVIPEVADSFFSIAINGIEEVAREKGYHVLIYLTHESLERETEILNEFKSGRVDGVLISVTRDTCSGSHITEAIEAGLPVVFFDRMCEDIKAGRVITDDYESSYNATRLLLDKGCRKLSFLSISPNLSINEKRVAGYQAAIKESGSSMETDSIVYCDSTDEYITKQLLNLLQKKNRPDGLIASVEKLVPPVYFACKELGIRIPDDIRLIGFTNLTASPILNPSLTTITQPAFEIGKSAAALLFKGIEKSGFDLSREKLIIPSQLQQRDSTC